MGMRLAVNRYVILECVLQRIKARSCGMAAVDKKADVNSEQEVCCCLLESGVCISCAHARVVDNGAAGVGHCSAEAGQPCGV